MPLLKCRGNELSRCCDLSCCASHLLTTTVTRLGGLLRDFISNLILHLLPIERTLSTFPPLEEANWLALALQDAAKATLFPMGNKLIATIPTKIFILNVDTIFRMAVS